MIRPRWTKQTSLLISPLTRCGQQRMQASMQHYFFPEDLGRLPLGTPASIWRMPEVKALASLGFQRGAAYQCQWANVDARAPTGILSNAPALTGQDALFKGWPSFGADGLYRGPLPTLPDAPGSGQALYQGGGSGAHASSAMPRSMVMKIAASLLQSWLYRRSGQEAGTPRGGSSASYEIGDSCARCQASWCQSCRDLCFRPDALSAPRFHSISTWSSCSSWFPWRPLAHARPYQSAEGSPRSRLGVPLARRLTGSSPSTAASASPSVCSSCTTYSSSAAGESFSPWRAGQYSGSFSRP